MYDVHNYNFKVQFIAYQGLLVVSFSVLYCTTFYILKKRTFRDAIAKENAWKEVSNQVRLRYKIVDHEK